ncbi:MAG: hypothetical protein HYT76_01855 [Deltaproteobacteria bacterium]|nr:hypothetical protein [Deltaproteobacteria bacterium]
MRRLTALARSGVSLIHHTGLPAAAEKVVGRVVGGVADVVVSGYESSAAQRLGSGFSPTLPSGARSVLLLRCLGHLQYAPRFIETLERGGLRGQTVFFSPEAERRRLLALKRTIAETFESLIVHPPENPAAIVGSSLGAVVSVFVAAPAKFPALRRELTIRRLDRLFPPTPHRNVHALHELAERLEGVRVMPMGGPLNEVELTAFGQQGIGGIEMVLPGTLRWLRKGYLNGIGDKPGLYQEIGLRPEDFETIVDYLLIGGAQTWGLHGGGPRSLVANAFMQGGTRLVSRLAVRRTPGELYDGVVGHRSALLPLGPGRVIVFPRRNHIDMMEAEEVAQVIVDLLS